jgi:hypothetical protein
MEDSHRTLVILLSMHRSGSSLTANAFMEQGLSLGPWALLPANPTNPHGYFEAMPILEVNRAVQTLIHGFRDDLPETEEAVAAFLATDACCRRFPVCAWFRSLSYGRRTRSP